jgi:hypothetical protein
VGIRETAIAAVVVSVRRPPPFSLRTIPKEKNKLIECYVCPSKQNIGGQTYEFQKNEKGQFVATVHDEQHQKCFLSLETYGPPRDAVTPAAADAAPVEVQTETKAPLLARLKELGIGNVSGRTSIAGLKAMIEEEEARLQIVAEQTSSFAAATEPASGLAPADAPAEGEANTDAPAAQEEAGGDAASDSDE